MTGVNVRYLMAPEFYVLLYRTPEATNEEAEHRCLGGLGSRKLFSQNSFYELIVSHYFTLVVARGLP